LPRDTTFGWFSSHRKSEKETREKEVFVFRKNKYKIEKMSSLLKERNDFLKRASALPAVERRTQ